MGYHMLKYKKLKNNKVCNAVDSSQLAMEVLEERQLLLPAARRMSWFVKGLLQA
jgi:hypothetical protein